MSPPGRPKGEYRSAQHEGTPVNPLDALNHVVNFLLPALCVGALAAALAKLAWRRELRGVRWRALAAWAAGAGVLASTAGLAVTGRDGAMATYTALVGAVALALWWRGFLRGGG